MPTILPPLPHSGLKVGAGGEEVVMPHIKVLDLGKQLWEEQSPLVTILHHDGKQETGSRNA